MQLTRKFEISSIHNIIKFINNEPVGRISSIDSNGFPQIIPMNFVFVQSSQMNSKDKNDRDFKGIMTASELGAVYMHSHPFGEKLENIRRNSKVGFEVDRHVCFLPSYFFHPSDASQADTLYISVVMKGNAFLVNDNNEKAAALNALMQKYQKEGRYEPLDENMPSVKEVSVIRVDLKEIRGKYKIGQHWPAPYRLKMARNIAAREGQVDSKPILDIMRIKIDADGTPHILGEPVL
jgi:nitroimidazol reductase NimA-like FMN-containing flavoprotein (pyridoxamine 5'-phosphate oxidase superfamily)